MYWDPGENGALRAPIPFVFLMVYKGLGGLWKETGNLGKNDALRAPDCVLFPKGLYGCGGALAIH